LLQGKSGEIQPFPYSKRFSFPVFTPIIPAISVYSRMRFTFDRGVGTGNKFLRKNPKLRCLWNMLIQYCPKPSNAIGPIMLDVVELFGLRAWRAVGFVNKGIRQSMRIFLALQILLCKVFFGQLQRA
jgi:hypothetical protein